MTVPNSLKLVRPNGALYEYAPSRAPLAPAPRGPFTTRIAFAAAHVVVDPLRTAAPLTHPVLDWDATLAYREYLWSLGFGVAEAMDTAQRGMGLDWPLALELIRRSTAAANARGALLFSGAGTDHLPASAAHTLDDVTAAYLHQCEAIEAAGGRIILMPLNIYQQAVGVQDWPFAAALSIIFTVSIVAITYLVNSVARKRMRGIDVA